MRLINVNCTTNPIKRSTGGNAVAAAAYRSGEDLYDEKSGETKRYSNRSDDVRESLILAPDDAPDWVYQRGALWNAAEIRERHIKGRPGRDVVVGFAWETSPDQQKDMAIEFASKHFTSRGHVCDIAFHKYGSLVRDQDKITKDKADETLSGRQQIDLWKKQELPFLEAHQTPAVDMPHVKIERLKGGDIKGYKLYQPHAHMLVTTRAIEGDDWSKTKNREFDRKETALAWRHDWADVQNTHLENLGFDTRVSTTRNSGSENLPTSSEQISAASRHVERKGEETMGGKRAAANQAMNDLMYEVSQETETNQDAPFHRVAVWWQNLTESFSDWKDSFAEKASTYLDYLKPDREDKEQGNGHDR